MWIEKSVDLLTVLPQSKPDQLFPEIVQAVHQNCTMFTES